MMDSAIDVRSPPADWLGQLRQRTPMDVGGVHQDVLVEERLPGQMLGWSALIPPHRFTLKAIAPLESERSAGAMSRKPAGATARA